MNGPHPSLVHHSLIIGTTKNPAIHPCPATVDLYRPVLSSQFSLRKQGRMAIKVQKLSISWSISNQPFRRSFNCHCPQTTTTIKVRKDQCRGSSSYKSILPEEQIWGDCLIALKLVVLVKDVIYDVYEYTEDIPLINWNNIIQTEELYIYGNSTRPLFEFRIPTPSVPFLSFFAFEYFISKTIPYFGCDSRW